MYIIIFIFCTSNFFFVQIFKLSILLEKMNIKIEETIQLNNENNEKLESLRNKNRKLKRKCFKNLLALSFSYLVQFSS